MSLRRRYSALTEHLQRLDRVLVAFSGGCDSSFLLAAAVRTLGRERVLAVTAASESLAARDRSCAESVVRLLQVPHRFLETDELQNPSYAANPMNRCFYCKTELFSKLATMARALAMTVVDGYNASDRGDIRPGAAAAREWQVAHPLDEAGLDKRAIRVLSRWMRLPTWNKPAAPCLSSRIPYGTPVTADVLRQIERAEEAVRAEGFRVVRVRHYGEEARIEVPAEELARLQDGARWPRIVDRVRRAGYARVTADPRGFQSGRLNFPTRPSAAQNTA